MNTQVEALKTAALACAPLSCADEAEYERRLSEFYSECGPDEVLGLIAENERLRGLLAPVAASTAKIRQRWLDNIDAATRAGIPKLVRQRLTRTYAEIQDSMKHGGRSRLLEEVDRLDRECDTVKAEREDLRKNADRYLVLRHADVDTVHNGGLFAGLVPDNVVINGEDLDQRTDAVIEEQRAFVNAVLMGKEYRCQECNRATGGPVPNRAYVVCACGARTPETAAQPGHPDFGVFAWLYTRPGTLDAQIHLTKQNYPGNWVENGGYVTTELYTGPANDEPAGWAYRLKLGASLARWQVSLIEPAYSGDPGDIEVKALYKRDSAAPVQAEVDPMRTFEIWSEGYRATGEAATATCHGTFEGATFTEAVQRYLETLGQENRAFYRQHNDGTWTCWGCRLFDNEADARKAFG